MLLATAILFKAVQVDPYMKIVGKMEDEVPAFFKRMRYPFAISKSALFAVGSPHTWPGLLAALVWLTDLLYYAEKAVRSLLSSYFAHHHLHIGTDPPSLSTHKTGNQQALQTFCNRIMQAHRHDPRGSCAQQTCRSM